jgi:signal transduction histidine kinase
MHVPTFVVRAALRVLVGGSLLAMAVAGIGLSSERVRFGSDLAAARARIERDLERRFTTLERGLDAVADRLRRDPGVAAAGEARDVAASRALFDRIAEAAAIAPIPDLAITLYGLDARPVAWAGRPASLPMARVTGPDAVFLATSPLGLRLTRVAPIASATVADRRVLTAVVEAPLPGASDGGPFAAGFVVSTSVVPVALRPGFEAAAGPQPIVIRGASGDALAAADVPGPAIDAARASWRARVVGTEGAILALALLLLCGPLVDWRRVETRVARHVVLTLLILALVGAARGVAWLAVRLARLDTPPLVPRDLAGLFWPGLASPVDFLLTAGLAAAIVALMMGSFEQWRRSRRRPVRVVPTAGPAHVAAFVSAQLAAGSAVGLLLVGYETFLRTRLVLMPYDMLHFSLIPLDVRRLAVGLGLVLAHASLVALGVFVFRLARAPWVVAAHARWMRAAIPALWLAAAAGVVSRMGGDAERGLLLPPVLIAGVMMAVAWRLGRYRAALEHASQAVRLTALFAALALPSLVFYPSLVDAHSRARRTLVESRYAPEVANQRRNLQIQVREALAQIDAVPDLADLVSAGEPAANGSPSTDAAYYVWSRTVLANQRSTSVELHDRTGALVSRFALELPHTGPPQTYLETTCQWEVLEEVSPFFAEERRLLHAGRGICRNGRSGRRDVVGAIAVHVMLDYSNLSFISAQGPYVALVRSPDRDRADATAREALELTVYGWSRRPLYMSGRDAWPLAEDVFQRILASRDPFWAVVPRADTEYDVLFLNDRGAIYALGSPRPSTFGHLINLAELTALSGAAYLVLLAAGLVYGAMAARIPLSARALLREVRASFYRKLFIAFVAAAVVPVLALALVTRAYIASLMQIDLEMEATRTAASASRVVADVGLLEAAGGGATARIDDDLLVWLSRVIAQDVNVFDGSELLASSERNLFASRILPTRTQGDVYRAIALDGRPSYVGRETVGAYSYLVAAAPVRVQNRDAILTVPLTLRQQEIEMQISELDRRVLLAVVGFILLGAAIGYSMAERIADPVNRLMKATGRIARGDLDARVLATSSDEFSRLVEAFNRMAVDLQRQRVELERTNRLAAWAEMARQVAHDIKNPLTPIQLNAEHLRRVHADHNRPLGPELDGCVNNILRQVRLLRQIAGEFSAFASSPTVRPAPTKLDELVADVIEPYRSGLAGRVGIDLDVPASLPPLTIDRTLIARALTNVVENALHAMPAGGRLRFAATLVDRRISLTIADTGVGMDRTALAHIFEPYFSTRATGTGLGLTIAKRNVELNGGTIAIESEVGRGTTVTVTLPGAGPAS